MEFVHRPYNPKSTIAAIATPPGEGGVAIVRISGQNALTIAAKIFSGPVKTYASHTAHFGKILDANKEVVDEVLLLVMIAPKSYTGEDVVEIHCHGGSLISRKVLETVLIAGAEPASPGEFTFKAFMNGRLDLPQAEAVQALIAAKSDLALTQAKEQLTGALSKQISSFQHELTDIAAILEAWVDFPEEGLEFASFEEVVHALEETQKKMLTLLSTFQNGKTLHEGLKLCLVGPPNAGKSSLMNTLLGKDRAIVTPIAGTTRDILEDEIRLGQLHFKIVDTAGIRETSEEIEKEGIFRSKSAMKTADLVLLVLDASQEVCENGQTLLHDANAENTIVVWNKIDLPSASLPQTPLFHIASVSAKEGIGLRELQNLIESVIWKKGPPAKDEVLITNVRHKVSLEQATCHLNSVIEGLKNGVSPEFLSSDMRATLSELGTIIGTNIGEDILSAIFSKFCIGK